MSESLFDGAVRPAYVRPTMTEALEAPQHGGIAVSSFSGAGGSTLGLRMAGWDVPLAMEFVPAAVDTYRANFPDARILTDDVRLVEPQQILDALGLAAGELDLFEGSPPCAGFSGSGLRSRGWGIARRYSGIEQRTDDLFPQWLRLVEGLRPRAVVAENVAGMMEGRALEEHTYELIEGLSHAGYRAHGCVLDASHFGVPQRRRRLIVIGYRIEQPGKLRHHALWPTFPAGTGAHHTLGDALASVDPNDQEHARWVDAVSMEPYAVGRAWEAMQGMRPWDPVDPEDPEGLPVRSYYSMFLGNLEKPCRTITAKAGNPSTASVVHPTENRKFTVAELLAIQGFPADFKLTGSMLERAERVGRAVPPPLYSAIGREIAQTLQLAR